MTDVRSYIGRFPKGTQKLLNQLRRTIKQTAPKGKEVINMPAFKLNRMLVWYAGYKNHIGFYPASSLIHVFKNELAKYKTFKEVIQFPLNKSIPTALVKKIAKFRMYQNPDLLKQKENIVLTPPSTGPGRNTIFIP